MISFARSERVGDSLFNARVKSSILLVFSSAGIALKRSVKRARISAFCFSVNGADGAAFAGAADGAAFAGAVTGAAFGAALGIFSLF